MAGEWPGFRADGRNPWTDRRRTTGQRTAEITAAPSLPKSVRARGKDRAVAAKAALALTAERVASGDLPVPAGNRSFQQQEMRANLVNGKTRSVPNHHLLGTALRFVPDGRNIFAGCVLRAARNGDTDAKAWWTVYNDLLPSHQARIDFDDVCEVAGVTPDRMMAIVVSTMMKMGADTAEFVSAVFHPKIVHQTARSAMRIGGEYADVAQRDRELMLQHGKFIAGPKGVNVNVSASANAAAAAQNAPSVPSFASTVLGAQEIQRGVQKQLEATALEAEVRE